MAKEVAAFCDKDLTRVWFVLNLKLDREKKVALLWKVVC